MTRYACLCALLLCGAIAFAQTQALSPVLPRLIVSKDGLVPTEGRAFELLREAAARAKIKLDFQIQPWPRAFSTANEHINVIIYPLVRTAERMNRFEWLGPVNKVEHKLFVLAKNAAKAASSVAELNDAPVGVLREEASESYFRATLKYTNIEVVNDFKSLFQMFEKERVMYIAAVPSTFYSELEAFGMPRSKVAALFSIQYTPDPYAYAAVKTGSDPALVRDLRAAFESMMRDGTWKTIFDKYE